MRRERLARLVTFVCVLVAIVAGGLILHHQSSHIAALTRGNSALIADGKRQEQRRRQLRIAQLRSLHYAAVKDCNGRHRIVVAMRQIIQINANADHTLRPLIAEKLKRLNLADCVVVRALPTSVKKS